MCFSRVKTYLIKDDGGKLIKIGKAVDPIKRLNQLQCGSASKLQIAHVFDADIEAILHMNFKENRSHGEWFCVDINDVIEFSKSINFTEFQQSKDEFDKNNKVVAQNCINELIPKSQKTTDLFHFDYISMLKTCLDYRLNPVDEVGVIIEIMTDMNIDMYINDCGLDLACNENLSPIIDNNIFSALQRANTVYIEDGYSFNERKEKLTALFNRKHKQKLIEETHLLNA